MKKSKPQLVTVTSRSEDFKDEGMFVFDRANKIMMCQYCDCRVAWQRKSVVESHCSSEKHKKDKEKAKAAQSLKRQTSLSDSFEQAKKIKIDKEVFIKSTVHAFVRANIPLHKLDHPEMRDWLKKYMPGSGDLPTAPCLRTHYLPLIKKDYDEELKKTLEGRKIVVLTDETTNKKGEAVLIILFLVLPDASNPDPLLIVAAVKVLNATTGDETSKAILHTLVDFNVAHGNVVGLMSDSAAYMTLCTRLLRELGLTNMVHLQCWAHKLDKVAKVFSDKLVRLNECVAKTKKLFKNTRKGKHRYLRFLKNKYSFTKLKEPKLFPLPVMTRWGSWRNSVEYLAQYVEDVVAYAKTIPDSDSVAAVQYFKKLTNEDVNIIKCEAIFTVDYCTPVTSLLLKLEASKVAFSHNLYSSIAEVQKVFSVLKSTSDVKSQLYAKTKNSLSSLSSSKCNNLLERIKKVAQKCDGLFYELKEGDVGKKFFTASQTLFNSSKIVMGSTSREKLLAAKNSISLLNPISDENFVVLHGLLADNVKEIVASGPPPGNDPTLAALKGMQTSHPEFVNLCLSVLYVPVSNVDCERGFSAYGDILSPKRTRLTTPNTEIMMCLYFGDDLSNNDVLDIGDHTKDRIEEEFYLNPDDPI